MNFFTEKKDEFKKAKREFNKTVIGKKLYEIYSFFISIPIMLAVVYLLVSIMRMFVDLQFKQEHIFITYYNAFLGFFAFVGVFFIVVYYYFMEKYISNKKKK